MLNEILEKYLKLFPLDRHKLELLQKQTQKDEKLQGRDNFNGHIAGDAIVFSPDHKKVLLIYHLHSQRWQQPGGHWDEDEEGPWLTAEREAIEETGVKIKSRINLVDDERIPLQIHTVPVLPSVKKGEPQHWHHNFSYGFIADSEILDEIRDEGIKDAKWASVDGEWSADLAEAIQRLQKLLNNKLKA